MPRKNASVVGLEIGVSALKLVEFLPETGQIAEVAIVGLDPRQSRDERYLQAEVRECVKRHAKHPVSDLVAAVPGGHAVLRLLDVPLQEEKVPDFIQWEMEQYLAQPLDQFLLDFQSLGPNAAETARAYLVAAFRRAEVERLKRILEGSGHPLAVLDVDIFAALNAFEQNYPEKAPQRNLIIKADLRGAQCAQAVNGHFSGLESFALPDDFAWCGDIERRAHLDALVDGLTSGATRALGEWGQLDNLVLCGDLARDEYFTERLEAKAPMELLWLNPFKEMAFDAALGGADGAAGLEAAGPQCAAALGLALRRGGDC